MSLDLNRARACLTAFDFRKLFIEELGWANCGVKPFEIRTDDHVCKLVPVAEQGGMVIYEGQPVNGDAIAPSHVRKTVEREVTKRGFEHLIIFTDKDRKRSVWLWVKREQGKTAGFREHTFHASQPGDALLQKLDGLFFDLDELDDQGRVPIITVVQRVKQQFDIEKVTKKFYEFFKTEHDRFLKFLDGIQNADQRAWFASVMLNRLMFIYFIQKKGLLNGDHDYLSHRLAAFKSKNKDQFYRKFLTPLFFEGFATEEKERTPAIKALLGKIPYLNGGIFLEHEIERQNPNIQIPDAAFDKLFGFFNKYQWHLDDRPYRRDDEINPDVLGYIFEKYINQKQMGAYYTKEDITDYICKNTILPFLFDKLATYQPKAVKPLPVPDIEPYIYPAVKTKDRLPTETDREYAARQKRLAGIREWFGRARSPSAPSEGITINDFITYNLDIIAYAQDFIRNIKDPMVLRAFYFECLKPLSVLDPTCGSGAFLFAALNILETLYELCLDKMEELGDGVKYKDFADELERVEKHPNRRYFIYKSIIVGNLYGVDIMEEATEICKLRLFLKLAAETDVDPGKDNYGVEPLPDIDFNIRAGNTLVGYANLAEVKGSLFGQAVLDGIRRVDTQIRSFRNCQTEIGIAPSALRKTKELINTLLDEIDGKLDRSLFAEYGAKDLNAWKASHQPFHWYVEFNSIMQNGGFDVIVGNPPFVEYSKVRNQYTVRDYRTEDCGNLYAYVVERATQLTTDASRSTLIIPMAGFAARRMQVLRDLLLQSATVLYASSYAGDAHPSVLFEGVRLRLAIIMWSHGKAKAPLLYTTVFQRWYAAERELLFHRMTLWPSNVLSLWHIFPRLGGKEAPAVWARLLNTKGRLPMHLGSGATVFYQEAAQYFVKATQRLPYFAKNGKVGAPPHGRFVNCTEEQAPIVMAILSSSLFYLWYHAVSDCYHLSDAVVQNFPCRASVLADPKLARLGKRLENELHRTAKRVEIATTTGDTITYAAFNCQACKPMMDEIDRVLAVHYGFTDEELDFIIHYDIKYRLGQSEED